MEGDPGVFRRSNALLPKSHRGVTVLRCGPGSLVAGMNLRPRMETSLDMNRLRVAPSARYALRRAESADDVRAAQVLRYEVFNLELQEGLSTAVATGRDEDRFDAVCDHLLVEHRPTGLVVGTYRLQTGRVAATGMGYYSGQEFDLAVLEPLRGEMIELGRACVHRQHRNLEVLGLLWKGIAAYARERGGRYLFGCSSVTSQDPVVGATLYNDLCRRHLVPVPFRVSPWPTCACPLDHLAEEVPSVPKLLRAYLAVGARICGPPAIDREFGTIDFLTWQDLEGLPPAIFDRFLR